MGDAGTMSVAAQDTLTGAGVQTVTGAKTFNDQKLVLRNPANTYNLSQRNPAITANADTYLNLPYRYHIFKVGSTYFAMNGASRSVDYSGATLDPVLTSVLAAITAASPSLHFAGGGAGDVLIDGGLHQLSGSFAGWTLPYALCTVKFQGNSRIEVPNGYTGFVFKFVPMPSPGVSAGQLVRVEGGYFTEAGSPAHLWDCFLLAPDSGNGIFNDSIAHVAIAGAGVGLHLRVDHGSGWCNGCVFDHMYMTGCNIGVNFDYNGQTPTLSNGFHRNTFYCLEGQAGTNSSYGFKDIAGIMNMFWDCKMWDMQVGAAPNVTANITANATKTRIHGGIMTSMNFTDSGLGTYYDDDVSGTVRKASAANNTPIETIGPVRMSGLGLQSAEISPPTILGTEFNVSIKQRNDTNLAFNITPFSDARTNTLNIYNNAATERLYIQRTGSSYVISTNKDAAGGTMRPMIFQTQDLVTGPTTTEVFRIQTDASMKFSTFHEHAVVTAPSNPAANLVRAYAKQVDTNNDGLFYKAKINGAVIEVQY